MKRKLKVVVILMFLFVLMPTFTGCFKTEVAEFKGISMDNSKFILKPIYVSTANGHSFVSYVEILDDDVKSYKIELESHSLGGVMFETQSPELACEPVKNESKYEKYTIDSSYLKDNMAFRLKYTFYDSEGCKNSDGKEMGHMFSSQIQTYLRTEDVVDIVGKEGYCNVDANGIRKGLDNSASILAKIAYSQVGYQGKSDDEDLNQCYGSGERNKYAKAYEELDLRFIEWVIQKSGKLYNLTLPLERIDIRDWAEKNGMIEGTNGISPGDIAILKYTNTTGDEYSETFALSIVVKVGSEIKIVEDVFLVGMEGNSYFVMSETRAQNKEGGRDIVGYIRMKDKEYKISPETQEIIDIVGKGEYCNVEAAGAYNDLGAEYNQFARIAYSQVGYYGKQNNQNLNVCDEKLPYWDTLSDWRYNKYGTSNDEGISSIEFIKWVAKKAGILDKLNAELNFPTAQNKIVNWAKSSDRFYTDNNKVKVGDLVIFGSRHVSNSVSLGIVIPGERFYQNTHPEIFLNSVSILYEPTYYESRHHIYRVNYEVHYKIGLGPDSNPGSFVAAAAAAEPIGYISMEGIAY